MSFEPSRLPADELYNLESALGPNGPRYVEAIRKSGRIVFHSVGDTEEGPEFRKNELSIQDLTLVISILVNIMENKVKKSLLIRRVFRAFLPMGSC